MTGREQDEQRLRNWWERTKALTPTAAELYAMHKAYRRVHEHDWSRIASGLEDRMGAGR